MGNVVLPQGLRKICMGDSFDRSLKLPGSIQSLSTGVPRAS